MHAIRPCWLLFGQISTPFTFRRQKLCAPLADSHLRGCKCLDGYSASWSRCRVTVVTSIIPTGPDVVSTGAFQSASQLNSIGRSDYDPRAVPQGDSNCRFGHSSWSRQCPWPKQSPVFVFNRYRGSHRVELRVDATVGSANGSVLIQRIAFQVTTLSKL
jgi:hypothetical protein